MGQYNITYTEMIHSTVAQWWWWQIQKNNVNGNAPDPTILKPSALGNVAVSPSLLLGADVRRVLRRCTRYVYIQPSYV